VNPNYPVYIVSKGRWETRLTSRALDDMDMPYRIVVEPQEAQKYAQVIDIDRVLVLPFSDLGQGSIPARNWIWEHSISEGHNRHWIIDDNVRKFSRWYKNERIQVCDGTIFRIMEDFVDRYENVALAGPHYRFFANTTLTRCISKPFLLNSRVYSIILVQNDIPFRWRGRYNEDTDLSLRVLKAGWCTLLFYAFLADKQQTMTMKGGNTDELYQGDGRWQMGLELQRQHPDLVKITRKWGRWQHHVNYRPFKANRLKRKPGVAISQGVNEYGMQLVNVAALA
jgi:hypothetical protein